MSAEIPKSVWVRAEQIYARNPIKGLVWGTATNDGSIAFSFNERESKGSPTIVPLDAETRQKYLNLATEELKSEGKL